MKALSTLIVILFCFNCAFAQTPAVADAAAKADTSNWTLGGGLGLDLSGLGIVNPRLGAGDNRLGFGGLVNFFANQKRSKDFWNNNAALQLAAVRIGGADKDFQKNLDILRIGSRYGYNILKDKLFLAIDGTAETQVLPTYVGNVIRGEEDDLLSDFIAPLRIAVAPGLDFKPSPHLSFFFAPASLNFIYVGNDSLAALVGQPLGNEAGKNNRVQLGYTAKAQYVNKYFNDRVAFSSKIGWFADYRQSLNGNMLWQNAMSINIFKGLALEVFGDMFYDHFTLVQVEKVPEGTSPDAIRQFLGLKPSYTGGFLLKYNKIF
jgi:hypothetical protein